MKDVKCVVWDLDDTLWEGTVLEGDAIKLKENIRQILEETDARGILHSVASKNDHDACMARLSELGIDKYFLYPQINWNAKSHSIDVIREKLNLGIDTFLFIDDQPFEREEVRSVHPDISCMDALEYHSLLSDTRLNPKFITEDTRYRRVRYLEDAERNREEHAFTGPKEQFLATLRMELIISKATEQDLQRAEELTIRTNQFNATGKTYNYEELYYFSTDPAYDLLVCELKDKFGSYGKIGLVLMEKTEACWHLRMMLMSCRVIGRGIGTVMLNYLRKKACENKILLQADFRQTARNRIMYVTFKFCSFREVQRHDDEMILESDAAALPLLPDYIKIVEN